ncbi:MAG: hypothetical protein ACOYI8_10635 [Christensenellales bacterium]|jgi:hypothetical protein
MKRSMWFFLACLLTIAIPCHAEKGPIPEEGLYTIGVQSNSRMFNVSKCVLHVYDGRMTAVITLGGTGYGYIYPGTAQEATDAPMDTWIPYVEDWEGAYTYALPIDALNEGLAVAAYSKRYEKWYDRTLVFHSVTLAPYDAIAPDGVYTGVIESDDAALDGKECILTARKGAMTLETSEGLCIEFTSLDKRVPMEDGAGWIMVRTEKLKERIVSAADGLYRIEVTTDSALLRFKSCMLKAEGGVMTAVLTAKNNSFEYLYVGTAADALKDEKGWIPAIPDAGGAYSYVLQIPSLDNEIHIATYSGKKKMWYDRTICLRSHSMIPEGEEQS